MRKSSRIPRKKPRSGAGNSRNASSLPSSCCSPATSAAGKPRSPKVSSPDSAPPPKTKSPVLPSPWFMSTAPQTPPRSTTPTFTASRISTISRLSASRIFSPSPPSLSSNGPSAFPCRPLGPRSVSNSSTWAATPVASKSRRGGWPSGWRAVGTQHCCAPNPCKPTNSISAPSSCRPAARLTHPSLLSRHHPAANPCPFPLRLLAWKKPVGEIMVNSILTPSTTEAAGIELKSYNTTIPMGSLAIGVDNIHHDVFLSPRFVQASREYLFDLIRQHTKGSYVAGTELRAVKGPDHTTFRKLLTDFMQSAVTQAKFHKNIEIDLLFRLSLLKFLTLEIGNQFANLILEGKEWVRQRGEHYERSQEAHVIKAKLSELQSSRRRVVRVVGQQVAQMVVDAEENVVCKSRRALFGEDFTPFYELLKNRLIFLDGGKDDRFFLENYVLLGNYVRDPDRFEVMDALFHEFLREAGIAISEDPAYTEANQTHAALLYQAQAMRNEIASLEEQREATRKHLDRGAFLSKFLSSSSASDAKASLSDIELRLKHQEYKLEELGPQIDAAKQKIDFLTKDHKGRVDDYLNEPENAQRLFDPMFSSEAGRPRRAKMLSELLDRLEQQDILFHVLASYEIRPIAPEYSPPVHLQQLRKALVSKEELKRVEQVLQQVPARKLSLKPIEELSRKIRRYPREEMQALVLRFAVDFLRLRREIRDADHLTTCFVFNDPATT